MSNRVKCEKKWKKIMKYNKEKHYIENRILIGKKERKNIF